MDDMDLDAIDGLKQPGTFYEVDSWDVISEDCSDVTNHNLLKLGSQLEFKGHQECIACLTAKYTGIYCAVCHYGICDGCIELDSKLKDNGICGIRRNVFDNNHNFCESFSSALKNHDVGMLEYLIDNLSVMLSQHYRKLTRSHIFASINESVPHNTTQKKAAQLASVLFKQFCGCDTNANKSNQSRQNKENLFKLNEDGFAAIHILCQLNNHEMLSVMLNEFGLNRNEMSTLINLKSNDKYWQHTPLMIAIKNRNIECIKILCKFFDIIDLLNCKSRYPVDCNAFKLACIYPNSSVLVLLFDTLLQQFSDQSGKSGLDKAAQHTKQAIIVDTLRGLQHQLHLRHKDDDKNNIVSECGKVISTLLATAQGDDIHNNKMRALRLKLRRLSREIGDNILQQGNNVKFEEKSHQDEFSIEARLRTLAVKWKANEIWQSIFKTLVTENGDDIVGKAIKSMITNEKYDIKPFFAPRYINGSNTSYVMILCENGFYGTLSVLLTSLQTKNSYLLGCDGTGNNLLHLAVASQNLETVKFLLENIYFSNSNNNINLNCNFENDSKIDITSQILNHTNNWNETPIIYACRHKSNRSLEIFKLLLKYKPILTQTKPNSWFPLYAACRYNNILVLKHMINFNIGLNDINESGDETYHSRPIMASIAMKNVECVDTICQSDLVDINTIRSKFRENYTALEYAAFFGNAEILRILLRTLMKRHKVKDYATFRIFVERERIEFDHLRRISSDGVVAAWAGREWKAQNLSCEMLLYDLINSGIKSRNYNYIALALRYKIDEIVQSANIPNITFNVTSLRSSEETRKLKQNAATVQAQYKDHQLIDSWYTCELIGKGSFGDVLKGIDRVTGDEVALKFISLKKRLKNKHLYKNKYTDHDIAQMIAKYIKLIVTEIDTIQKINHDNVIKLLAYNLNVDNNGQVMLVFEYAQCGELYQFLNVSKYFTQQIAKTYFEQILDALQVCHAMGIIHRDLKPQNILLDSKFNIKIADFGLSTYVDDIQHKNRLFVGTRGYMSPEIASPIVNFDDNFNAIHQEITSACDIFSLGVILWQMLNGIESMPFDEARESDGKYMYICSKEYDLFWRCHHKCRIMKKAKATTFSQLTHLLLRLFEYRADKRITINQIQRHPWFKSVRGYNGDEFLRKHFESTMKNIQFQLVTQQLSLQVQLSKNKTNSQQPQSHLSSIQPSVGQQSTATNFKFSTLTDSVCGPVPIYKIFAPLVIPVVIGDYKDCNLPSLKHAIKDYQHIINCFNYTRGYHVGYLNAKNELQHLNYQISKSDLNNIQSCEFKILWTCDEIEELNEIVHDELLESQNTDYNFGYDSIIYILSCHGDRDECIYDSNGESMSISFVINTFNNANCKQLRQKPKLYFFDTNRINNSKKSKSSSNSSTGTPQHNAEHNAEHNAQDTKENEYKEARQISDNVPANPNVGDNKTICILQTYTQENHCRKIFGNTAELGMLSTSSNGDCVRNKSIENGGILIQSLCKIVSNNMVFLNDDFDDILIEIRQEMAKLVGLTNNTDSVVMIDHNRMPYKIRFNDKNKNVQMKNKPPNQDINAKSMMQTTLSNIDENEVQLLTSQQQSVFGSQFYLANYQTNFANVDMQHDTENDDSKTIVVDLNTETKHDEEMHTKEKSIAPQPRSRPTTMVSNALIAVVGMSDYDSMPNLDCVKNDYKNIHHAFHHVRGYSFVTFDKNNKIIHQRKEEEKTDHNAYASANKDKATEDSTAAKNKNKNKNTPKQRNRDYKVRWIDNEIFDFNEKVLAILENSKYHYDCLIYFISCHGDAGGIIYDSEENKIPLISIFEHFNNQNCIQLRNKPKIYFIDACRGGMTTKRFANSNYNTKLGAISIDVSTGKELEEQDMAGAVLTQSMSTSDSKETEEIHTYSNSNSTPQATLNKIKVKRNVFSKYNYNREIYANTDGYAVVEPYSKGAYLIRSITKAFVNDKIFEKDFDTIMIHTRNILLKLMGKTVECGAQVIDDRSNIPKKIFFKQQK